MRARAMVARYAACIASGLVLVATGCMSEEPTAGPVLGVNVAALNLPGVGDVVWDVEVVNGADPAQTVWQRRLSSSRYGDGAGSASYVGSCDADPAVNDNTVRVWVVGVYAAPVTALGSFASGAVNGATGSALEFQSPTTAGPLTQAVTCEEDADVFVQFDVALMRPARQGFFDIAVSFNDIFCSAKFDCCTDATGNGCAADGTEDIRLLFAATGDRGPTLVLGFACTAGAREGVETELYLDALQLDCTSPTAATFAADITLNPSGAAGNQCAAAADGMSSCTGAVTEANDVDADDYLFQFAVYRGLEQLQSGGVAAQVVYWNAALGVKKPAIGGCWLRARGTADDANGAGVVDNGTIAPGAVYPYVQWEVDLGTCAREALTFGDAGAMVRPEYTTTGGAGQTFAYGFGPSMGAGSFCPATCENGGQCISGACVCPTGFSGATCGTNDDDCIPNPCGTGTCVDGVASYSCGCPAGTYDDGATCVSCTPIANCASGLGCTTAADSQCATCSPGYVAPSCTNVDIIGARTSGDPGRWADGSYARSCREYRYPAGGYTYTGSTGDGRYAIDPDGAGGDAAFEAYCDMTSDGGGWTLTASVATHASFWSPTSYTASTSARAVTIGTPSLTADYVLRFTDWSRLFANRGASSEFRLTVRRVDNNQVATLGFLDGLQMDASGAFTTNPSAARKGNGTVVSPAASACVIQYVSDFTGTITNEAFQSGDSACTGFLGWNGSCGYTSLGHTGDYYQSSSNPGSFAHACSLDLTYYCSSNRTTGPPSGTTYGCNYFAKWYWIR